MKSRWEIFETCRLLDRVSSVISYYLSRHVHQQHCSNRPLCLAVTLFWLVLCVGFQHPEQTTLPAHTQHNQQSQRPPACQQKQTEVEMCHTRVRPWTGTSRGMGTVGPDLSRSRPPSSAGRTASPGTNTETKHTTNQVQSPAIRRCRCCWCQSIGVSYLVKVIVLFHPVQSAAQHRPALRSERGWDAFLTLQLDLKWRHECEDQLRAWMSPLYLTWRHSDLKSTSCSVLAANQNEVIDFIICNFNASTCSNIFGKNSVDIFYSGNFRSLSGHTLLVFFNKMRSHWAMMFIHLASLCLTNSGGGPTLLMEHNSR